MWPWSCFLSIDDNAIRDLVDGWLRYYCPRISENVSKGSSNTQRRTGMAGFVQDIFFAPEGGAQMKGVQAATALEGCGLEGDRYCAGTGHWNRFGRVCEVTFITAEDLHNIERETGVGVKNGEHRRNVVTRGISLKALRRGEWFRVGEVVFEYRGPRSVCRYIERLTEPGMTQALRGRGGICARVVENGTVRVGDKIEVLQRTEERPQRQRDER
jgi:MOSC domain-containing protein YiiM